MKMMVGLSMLLFLGTASCTVAIVADSSSLPMDLGSSQALGGSSAGSNASSAVSSAAGNSTSAASSAIAGSSDGGNSSSLALSSASYSVPSAGAGIYVTPDGDDASWAGDKAAPVRSLQVAVGLAVSNGMSNIFVAEGVYSPGYGLNAGSANGLDIVGRTNIRFYGGWDTNFTAPSGYSVLDGEQTSYRIVLIENSTGITMNRFSFINGNCTDHMGGGVCIYNADRISVVNSISSNNYAKWGGGAYVRGNDNTIDMVVVNNSAEFSGGGVMAENGSRNSYNGTYDGNSAGGWGGGLYQSGGSEISISGVVRGNGSTNGGGIYLTGTTNISVISVISNNNAAEGEGTGGGIYTYLSSGIQIAGVISGNLAKWGGGGYLQNCSEVSNTGSVLNNTAILWGGGFNLDNVSTSLFNSSISGNTAALGGGGIAGSVCDHLSIGGLLSGNESAGTGGGAAFYGIADSVFSADMTGNVASNFGGALAVLSGSNLNINSLISGNQVLSTLEGAAGGGLYMSNVAESLLQGEMRSNICGWMGGAATYVGCVNSAIESTMLGNIAEYGGGALAILGGSNSIIQCLMSNNSIGGGLAAWKAGGGAALIKGAIKTKIKSAIKDCIAEHGAAILLWAAPDSEIVQTLVDYGTNAQALYSQLKSVVEFKDTINDILELKNTLISNCTIGGGGIRDIFAEYWGADGRAPEKPAIIGNEFDTSGGSTLYRDKDGNVANNADELGNVGVTNTSGNATTNSGGGSSSSAGASSASASSAAADNTPPAVAINSPANNDDIAETNGITFAGTASDDGGSGLSTVSIALEGPWTWGGYKAVSFSGGAWTTNITVGKPGVYTFKAMAADSNGNTSEIILTTNVKIGAASDPDGPTLTVASPADNATIQISGANTNVTFSGTASDTGAGVRGIYVSTTGDNFSAMVTYPVTNAPDSTNWSFTLQLAKSNHTIYILCRDFFDNTSTTNIVHVNVTGAANWEFWTWGSSVFDNICLSGGTLYFSKGNWDLCKFNSLDTLNGYAGVWGNLGRGALLVDGDNIYCTGGSGYIRKGSVATGNYNDIAITGVSGYNNSGFASSGSDLYIADGGTSSTYSRILVVDPATGLAKGWIGKDGRSTGAVIGWHGTNESGMSSAESYATTGTEDGAFGLGGPKGIVIDNSEIYAVDNGNNRIQVLTLTGNFVRSFGSAGSGDGQLNNPTYLAVANGMVYVIDSGNSRIAEFTTAGTFVRNIGDLTGNGGKFINSPTGIACDGTYLYVVESRQAHKIDVNFIGK